MASNMIAGLERLYDPREWEQPRDTRHGRLMPDSRDPSFLVNEAFGGSIELRAAEALYATVRVEADRARAESRSFVAAETGTCDGFSTAFMARAVLDSGGSGRVWTCELFALRDGTRPFKWPHVWNELGLASVITAVGGDSRSAAVWAGSSPPLPAELDLILIDSEHTFETVVAEWTVLGPRLRPGGVVLFHDADLFSGVAQAIAAVASELRAEPVRLDSCRGLALLRRPV